MNYYNEWDSKAADWLRELIKEGLIPKGEVDERSITDVQPGDLRGFTQCHFFAGIGGWSLALQLADWPESRPVWTGSCPCQPFSDAGKGLGEADPRHLWPYFRNLIGNCRPPVVFGEQVGSKAGRLWISRVRSDFQSADYAFGAADLAAASLGAPHKRQRLFWVADSQFNERRANQPGREPEGRAADGRDCSQPSGLADSAYSDRRSREHIPQEGVGQDGQRRRGPSVGRANGRMANTDGGKPKDGQLQRSGGQLQLAQNPPVDGRLGDTPEHRCEMRLDLYEGLRGEGSSERCIHDFWRDTRWIPTTDPRTGKTVMRRIPLEPSLFPLAERVPGRVGILRGAGNAIVPQIAAEFIEAFLETLE